MTSDIHNPQKVSNDSERRSLFHDTITHARMDFELWMDMLSFFQSNSKNFCKGWKNNRPKTHGHFSYP
jgi:hypothetical protein